MGNDTGLLIFEYFSKPIAVYLFGILQKGGTFFQNKQNTR